MKLVGKVALVMGGSQALGRAIAIEFAEQGARVVVCSRLRPDVPEVVSALTQRGLEATWEPGDMTDPQSVLAVVNRVVERHGRLDVLVVSGSPSEHLRPDLFEAIEPSHYHGLLDSQFVSRLNCLHAAIRSMSTQGYGKVIFVTSDAGRTPTPGESLVG